MTEKEIEIIFNMLSIYLIRAKVDLEYGMGFSKNKFLLDCMKEIDSALDLIPVKNK